MNHYIHDALTDIERRIKEILDDLHSIQEQLFYTYDPNDSETEVTQEELETERKEALEHLTNIKK